MVGRLVSFWDGLFSGAMLVLGRVIQHHPRFAILATYSSETCPFESHRTGNLKKNLWNMRFLIWIPIMFSLLVVNFQMYCILQLQGLLPCFTSLGREKSPATKGTNLNITPTWERKKTIFKQPWLWVDTMFPPPKKRTAVPPEPLRPMEKGKMNRTWQPLSQWISTLKI